LKPNRKLLQQLYKVLFSVHLTHILYSVGKTIINREELESRRRWKWRTQK